MILLLSFMRFELKDGFTVRRMCKLRRLLFMHQSEAYVNRTPAKFGRGSFLHQLIESLDGLIIMINVVECL